MASNLVVKIVNAIGPERAPYVIVVLLIIFCACTVRLIKTTNKDIDQENMKNTEYKEETIQVNYKTPILIVWALIAVLTFYVGMIFIQLGINGILTLSIIFTQGIMSTIVFIWALIRRRDKFNIEVKRRVRKETIDK